MKGTKKLGNDDGIFNSERNKEPIVEIHVTDCERRIIINSLKKLRDEQIRENKNYDFIETIIGKVAMADPIKHKNRGHDER